MTATEIQKLQALYQRSASNGVAGVNLAGDIYTLLRQLDQLGADEVRQALREALWRYLAHREQARETYRKRGIELGELLPW